MVRSCLTSRILCFASIVIVYVCLSDAMNCFKQWRLSDGWANMWPGMKYLEKSINVRANCHVYIQNWSKFWSYAKQIWYLSPGARQRTQLELGNLAIKLQSTKEKLRNGQSSLVCQHPIVWHPLRRRRVAVALDPLVQAVARGVASADVLCWVVLAVPVVTHHPVWPLPPGHLGPIHGLEWGDEAHILERITSSFEITFPFVVNPRPYFSDQTCKIISSNQMRYLWSNMYDDMYVCICMILWPISSKHRYS